MSRDAIVRRQCKRAMRQLITDFGYSADYFDVPTDKNNEYDVLPGTPIFWSPTDYNGETDSRKATEELQNMRMGCDEKYWRREARQMDVQGRDLAARLRTAQ